MKIKTFLAIIVMIWIGMACAVYFAYAQEAAEPPSPWTDLFPGARYQEGPNAMIIEVMQPLMRDRLAIYGNLDIKTDPRTGRVIERKVNEADKDKVTDLGMDIRTKIMLLEYKSANGSRGIGMVSVCSIEYNRITVFKYDIIPWDLLKPELFKVLEVLR